MSLKTGAIFMQRGIVGEFVSYTDTDDVGCSQCPFFADMHTRGCPSSTTGYELACIGGHFVPVSLDRLSDEQRVELVTQGLMG